MTTGEPEPTLPSRLARFNLSPVLYPNEYVWFVFVSSLDICLTWAILGRGGSEVNPIARRVIETWDLPGAIGFKFALTIFVIVICEYIGRRESRTALWLARLAVTVSAVPPAWSLILLAYHIWFGAAAS
ncbi:MAG: DUF5658 family protein [Planctomycetota bacterium]|jgi:hypothetical protein